MADSFESKLPSNFRALVNDVLKARSTVEKAEAKVKIAQASLTKTKSAAASLEAEKAAFQDEIGSSREALANLLSELALQEDAVAQQRAQIELWKEQVEVLLLASEVTPEIIEALAAIDRRQLSEVSKLGKPPEAVKKALDVVCVFVDVFGGLAETRESDSTEYARDAMSKLGKKRTWDAIRAEMAVDLRKSLVGINPELLAEDHNEESLLEFHKRMGSQDVKKIARASKPVGILFRWCTTMVECAVSIRKRRETEASILEMETNIKPLLDDIAEAQNKVDTEKGKLAELAGRSKELEASCDAANQLLSEASAEAGSAEQEAAAERGTLERLERELGDLKAQNADLLAELEGTRERAAKAVAGFASELSRLESKRGELGFSIKDLREQELKLAESSQLPPEVLLTLEKLDRRALSEITRMSSPPKTVKASLEIVYLFLEVFPSHKSEAALADLALSSHHPKGGRSGGQGGVLPKPKAWPVIRKLLAVDLRPRLLAITPALVACKENEPLVAALREPMSKLKAGDIERASKPAGLLWIWCNALVLCDESIKSNRVVTAQLRGQEEEARIIDVDISRVAGELASEEATVALIDELTKGLSATPDAPSRPTSIPPPPPTPSPTESSIPAPLPLPTLEPLEAPSPLPPLVPTPQLAPTPAPSKSLDDENRGVSLARENNFQGRKAADDTEARTKSPSEFSGGSSF